MADRVTALIVAAGSGSRLGGGIAKQFRLLSGTSVLRRAVDALSSHPRIDAVRIVVSADQSDIASAQLDGVDVGALIPGGAQRSDSVRAGLEAIGDGIVLVHDAARPFCPSGVIDRLLDMLDSHDGAVPVLSIADTLAKGDRQLTSTIDRARMLRVQTPQAFHVEDLLFAMDEAGRSSATDESSVMIEAGLKVATVEGSEDLFKLTNAEDWKRAEMFVEAKMISRTGMGFDVHAFDGPGPVMLGGIAVPHERGLAGHSDADVALHAITDAILGAAAMGDIGQHFPPSDPQWKGASSDRFLMHAAKMVRDAGGRIDHVDCTIICEMPKVGPHREAIQARVADILALPTGAISIKATTTEQLGFTGRGEGIAAQAVATIRMERSVA